MKIFGNNYFNLVFVSLFLYSFVACSNTDDQTHNISNTECISPVLKPEWLGKTLQEAKQILSEPVKEESFSMGDVVINEFRGNLDVLLPRSISENNSIKVKEVYWLNDDCYLTIWFKQTGNKWIAIDTVYWHKNTDF